MTTFNKSAEPFLFFVITLLSGVIIAFTLIPAWPGLFFHDDSFFYIKTAYNISSAKGSTFDTLNPTNGYHPLYMLLLAAVSAILPLTGVTGIRTVFIVDFFLLASAVYIVDILLKKLSSNLPARLLVILAIITATGFNDFGIEARLLVPLASALFLITFASNLDSKIWLSSIGLLGAAVFLTRIDMIAFLCVALPILLTKILLPPCSKTITVYLKSILLVFTPIIITVAGYLLYNICTFGHFASISSWLKTGFPGTFSTGWLATCLPGIKARFFFCLFTAALYLLCASCQAIRKGSVRAFLTERVENITLIAANTAVFAYLSILALFSQGGVASWYFALPLTISLITWLFLPGYYAAIPSFLRRYRNALVYTASAIVLLACIFFVRTKINGYLGIRQNTYLMGQWINDKLPQDVRIFQVDASGFTGYFSQRAVINGDGLINSWQYQDYLADGRLIDYLRRLDVRYILWSEYHDEHPIRIPVPRKNRQPIILTFSTKPSQPARFGKLVLLEASPDILLTQPDVLSPTLSSPLQTAARPQ